jgi:ABC-type phosphate transport system permease subunit/ABC-type phosphate transport system auxiliary subunit
MPPRNYANPKSMTATTARTPRPRPGLKAEGEVWIWLTGGTLALCVAMIVGLLALLAWQGLRNFWPKPLLMVPSKSGELVLGKLQGEERSKGGSPLPIGKESGAAIATESDLSRGRRLYLRTGNFEWTNRHFTYVSNVDSNLNDAWQPIDAWALERRKMGRLFAFPTRMIWHAPRFPDEMAEQIAQCLEAVKSVEAESETAASSTLRQILEDHQQKSLRDGLVQWIDHRRKEGYLICQQQADGSLIPSADDAIAFDNAPTHLVACLDAGEGFNLRFESWLQRSQRYVAEGERIQKAISRIDSHIEKARLKLRQYEIDNQANLLPRLSELEQAAAAFASRQQKMDHAAMLLKQLAMEPSMAERISPVLNEGLEWLESARTAEQGRWKELQTQFWAKTPDADTDDRSAVEVYMEQLVSGRIESAAIQDTLEVAMSAQAEQIVTWSIPQQLKSLPELDASPDRWLESDQAKSWLSQEIPGADAVSWRWEGIPFGDQGTWWTGKQPGIGTRYLWYSGPTDSKGSTASLLPVHDVPMAEIVRGFRPNALTTAGKWKVYGNRWWELVSSNPREANSEGGLFPAIWGTIVMTMIMTLVGVPFGVMAALYLREYAKSGWMVSLIRICINNLAGVPSIVYGVFGLAFFCYTVGAWIDGGSERIGIEPWPTMRWFAGLVLLAVSGMAAFWLQLSASEKQGTSHRMLRIATNLIWLGCAAGVLLLIVKNPYFHGLYQASLPNPTFGKGGLLWASLTLALLTLPVVIVATEEAIAAVPNSLREGAFACGASRWQTIRTIVLPLARPGILTGMILAMARGAGEVAPLMLVGALPSAVDLPLDGEAPFLHGSRSFMHLGFQIYTLGFQSQNSEATKPMVFTATLVLLMIVLLLNLTAIVLRNRLRQKQNSGVF